LNLKLSQLNCAEYGKQNSYRKTNIFYGFDKNYKGTNLDTELLKTFLEVQKTRHFGKAAENLYLTQSAVSFRIRQLEQSLGVALFTRFRNNIQLTSAGELLLPHARAVIQAMIAAKQQLMLQSGRPVPYQWQIASELNFLLQMLPTWPLSELHTLQVQILSSTATIQEPFQRTDGYIGFATNNTISESTERYTLGFLKLVALASPKGTDFEVRWDIPLSLLPSNEFTVGFASSDAMLVRNYLKSHAAQGYLPEPFMAGEDFVELASEPLWLEICAYAPVEAEWPSDLAKQLQAATLLYPARANAN
jgi:DNA-binding transcriptional LysR family regulator